MAAVLNIYINMTFIIRSGGDIHAYTHGHPPNLNSESWCVCVCFGCDVVLSLPPSGSQGDMPFIYVFRNFFSFPFFFFYSLILARQLSLPRLYQYSWRERDDRFLLARENIIHVFIYLTFTYGTFYRIRVPDLSLSSTHAHTHIHKHTDILSLLITVVQCQRNLKSTPNEGMGKICIGCDFCYKNEMLFQFTGRCDDETNLTQTKCYTFSSPMRRSWPEIIRLPPQSTGHIPPPLVCLLCVDLCRPVSWLYMPFSSSSWQNIRGILFDPWNHDEYEKWQTNSFFFSFY